MSKQAKMFKDLLDAPTGHFLWTMEQFRCYPNMFTVEETTVLNAFLSFVED